jgi:tRNA(Ile)-lysidine synthase
MVEERFRNTIVKYNLIKKKEKLMLGVSGGPDSVCMLHLFEKIRNEFKLDLLCVHFNHLLREEAERDEIFVRNTCSDLKIKYIGEKKDVRALFRGDSLEQTARNLRFDFFLKCARESKIKKIALAHNKDDVAETVLMRMLRGASLKGLRGILPLSKVKGVFCVRPLFELRKSEILEWVHKNNISYCIDKTNLEDNFLRNKIRLKLLPYLEEFNPNIVETLFSMAKTVALDYDFMYNLSHEMLSKLKKHRSKSSIKLSLQELKAMHPTLIFNILRVTIEELKGNMRKLELRHMEEVLDLVYHRPVMSVVDLPDLEVKKEEKWLTIKSLLF